MGLKHARDRLCMVQLCDENGEIHLVHFTEKEYLKAHNLIELLSSKRTFIFHFARFDVAVIHKYLNVLVEDIFCTKIASKLVRTYTDSHGLKDLCRELLNINLSKQQQSSYWGDSQVSKDQLNYAAGDVLYLHKLKESLTRMLIREGRLELSTKCFEFIPVRSILDISGWEDIDIFAH